MRTVRWLFHCVWALVLAVASVVSPIMTAPSLAANTQIATNITVSPASYNIGDTLTTTLHWTLPSGLKKGAMMSIEFPAQIAVLPEQFTIAASDGTVYGIGTIKSTVSPRRASLVFNSTAAANIGASGTTNIPGKITDNNYMGTTQTLTYNVNYGAAVYTPSVTINAQSQVRTSAIKWGEFTKLDECAVDATECIVWELDSPAGPLNTVVFSDTAGPGYSFVCSTLTVVARGLNQYGYTINETAYSNYTVNCTASSFTVTAGAVASNTVLTVKIRSTANQATGGRPTAYVNEGSAAITSSAGNATTSSSKTLTSQSVVGVGNATYGKMQLTKSATVNDANGNSLTDAGDQITWSFVVLNTGTYTLSALKVTDPTAGTITCPATSFAPNASTTCTASPYVITTSDATRGQVLNYATASATANSSPLLSNTSSKSVSVSGGTPSTSSMTITKSAAVTDANSNSKNDLGDKINWSYVVKNTGTAALTNVAVNDPKAGTVTCPATSLAAGAQTTCTAAAYTITQTDVDAGVVTNSATASAKDPTNATINATASTTNTSVVRTPGLTITKSAVVTDVNSNSRTDLGDRIAWSFVVKNTGTVTLTSVTVTDAKAGTVSCPVTTLAPGASATCTAAVYTITQSDVNAGVVTNNATASGKDPANNTVNATASSTSTNITQSFITNIVLSPTTSTLWETLVGSVSWKVPAGATAGTQYTVMVSNQLKVPENSTFTLINGTNTVATGTVSGKTITFTLTAYGAANPGLTGTGTIKLWWDETVVNWEQTPSVSYTVDGATGKFPQGLTIMAYPNSDTNLQGFKWLIWQTTENPSPLTTVKWGLRSPIITSAMVGKTLQFKDTAGAGLKFICTGYWFYGPDPWPALSCDATQMSASFTITSAMVGKGLELGAWASVTQRMPEYRNSGEVTIGTTKYPMAGNIARGAGATLTDKVAFTKSAAVTDANGNGKADLGDKIAWSFTATNNSDATVTSFGVSDPKAGTVTCGASSLAPGASTTCTAGSVYTITQADVDVGVVTNTATTTGTDFIDNLYRSTSTTNTAVAQASGLTITKSAAVSDVNANSKTDLGDRIAWSFVVKNTGTVTLNSVAVSDAKAGAVTCSPTTLAPNAQVTCTAAAYTITQADVDAGSVVNTANASAKNPAGNTINTVTPGTTTTNVVQTSGLTITKSAAVTDVNTNSKTDLGDRITWSFVVKNTGTVTLSNVAVIDPKAGTVTCSPTSLAPNAQVTCTAAAYTITQTDVDAGVVTNSATASAKDPKNVTVNAAASTTSTNVSGQSLVTNIVLTPTTSLLYSTLSGTVSWKVPADATAGQQYMVTVSNQLLVPENSTFTFMDGTNTVATGTVSGKTATLTLSAYGAAHPGLTGTSTIKLLWDDTVVSWGAIPNVSFTTDGVAGRFPQTLTIVDHPNPDPALQGSKTLTWRDPRPTPLAALRWYLRSPTITSDMVGKTIKFVDVMGFAQTPRCTSMHFNFVPYENWTNYVCNPQQVSNEFVIQSAWVGQVAEFSGSSYVHQRLPDYRNTGQIIIGTTTYNVAAKIARGPGATFTDQIALTKSATVTDVNSNGVTDLGDRITWSFAAINNGDAPVTGFGITDPKAGAVTCAATTLQPAASTTCTAAAYTVTQTDVNAGVVTNTATTTGTDFLDNIYSSTSTTTTPVAQSTGLSITKSATVNDLNGDGQLATGDRVTWTYIVINTGTVTLSNRSRPDSGVNVGFGSGFDGDATRLR